MCWNVKGIVSAATAPRWHAHSDIEAISYCSRADEEFGRSRAVSRRFARETGAALVQALARRFAMTNGRDPAVDLRHPLLRDLIPQGAVQEARISELAEVLGAGEKAIGAPSRYSRRSSPNPCRPGLPGSSPSA